MASAIDVAAFILERVGNVTTMKLQKLVYYSQVRYLVQKGEPLFRDDIQAWANGPVSPNLFHAHAGQYMIGKGALDFSGSSSVLSSSQKQEVNRVVDSLGSYSGEQLRELSHGEKPWLDARKGCAPGERCSAIISVRSMVQFYGSPQCTNPIVR